MGLDNVKEKAINSHEGELESALKDIREKGKSLKSDIMEIDNNQLKQIVEKNFKDASGKWKTYQEMVKTPGYNFIVQATIDLFWWENSKLDAELKKYGGIDMIYGKTTSRLVKEIQKQLKITPDWRAGAWFFDAVLKYLDKSEVQAVPVVQAEEPKEDAQAVPVVQAEEPKEDAQAVPVVQAEEQKEEAQVTQAVQAEEQKEEAEMKAKSEWAETREVQSTLKLFPSIDNFEHRTEKRDMVPDEGNFGLWAERNMSWFNELTKELTQDPLPEFTDIYVKFWAWTDWTPVRSKRFNKRAYMIKKEGVMDFVSRNYKGPNREELLDFIRMCDFWTSLSGKWFNNEWLLWMRNLECVKWIVESYNKWVEENSDLQKVQLHLAYDPSMNVAWATRDEVKERFGRIKIWLYNPEPEIPNPDGETPNPDGETPNPDGETPNPEPGTQDPEPGTQDPEPGTPELGS